MRVAIYARVSTEEQQVENQYADFRKWILSHGVNWDDVNYYAENESAWKQGHQHELSIALKELRTGKRKFDVFLVWALDRLTREGSAATLDLVNTFKLYGVRVISIKEPWTEVEGPMAELFYSIIGWVAKFESDRKSERVKAAHAKLREQGKHIGRPKGKRDGKKRKTTGYLLRYATKKLPENFDDGKEG